MHKFMIHVVIYIISVISYIYLNDIIISPISMCSMFIKFNCNRSLKDSDVVSQPDSVNIPFEDVKKVGDAIEKVVEEATLPENKSPGASYSGLAEQGENKVVKKMVSWLDCKKKN